MNDVASWLDKLGLGSYQTLFSENDIDAEVLPALTEEHLKELGVSLGHRVKLLKAIEALSQQQLQYSRSVTPIDTSTAPVSPSAERRQLTVMMVDLVGSTALSSQLDPEDLSVLLRRYQNTVAGEIERLEGFVARYMGDGVLAYFGWPRAHEDSAERAVRVALSIVREVSGLRTPDENPLATRVGIATGQVVVGELIGEGSSQEEAVVGETPNIAARLEALAEPGYVLVTDSTRQLCGEVFEFESLGPQSLKGVADAVEVYRVGRERSLESRFQAQQVGAVLPLVGRDSELAQIMARWRLARGGEGQMILLTGEAGIGKSRLMRAVEDSLQADSHLGIRYQCSPYHTDSALYPVIQQLMHAAGFEPEDTNEVKLNKLEVLLKLAGGTWREHVPLIADLLNLDSAERYDTIDLIPEQKRIRTLQALIGQLTALAQHQSVLLILEDAHWIDPTTLELIELALDAVSKGSILMLITARPTFVHSLGNHPIATHVILNALARDASQSIIERLCDKKNLPHKLVAEILRKTDGIPLFVEELTKTVLKSGQLRETESAYVLSTPLETLDIPSSLHDSLMARLDRLHSVREVAQIAACIGREFNYALLQLISGLDGSTLQNALTQLTEAELIFKRGQPPISSYVFKHALVQDTAYASLLRHRRQHLHARIAKALYEQGSNEINSQPELIAFHFTQAGLVERALISWKAAAQRALNRSAYVEALSHLNQALTQLELLPIDDVSERHQLDLLVMKFSALFPIKGPSAPEADRVSANALALCRRVGDGQTLLTVLFTRWLTYFTVGQQKESASLANEYLQCALDMDSPNACVIGYRLQSIARLMAGDITESCRLGYEALQRFDKQQGALRVGRDAKIANLNYLAVAEALAGRTETAQVLGEEAVSLARRLGRIGSLASALLHANFWLPTLSGRIDTLHRHRDEFVGLTTRHSLTYWEATFSVLWAAYVGRDIGETRKALVLFRQTLNVHLLVPQLLCQCASLHLEATEIDEAHTFVAEAEALIEQYGEAYWRPEIYRLYGQIERLRSGTHPHKAVTQYQRAVALAEQQGNRLLQLRAATDLARLWAELGSCGRARNVLNPLYSDFSEGFDTIDLRNAKAVLDELNAPDKSAQDY